MKKLIYLLIVVLSLSGCASTTYFYQLCKAESDDISKNDGDKIVYQNDEVDIISDFWGDRGNSSFMIYNKTDSNLYVDLGKSHLIVNGIAQTYFQNRMFTESSSSSLSFGSSYTTAIANKSTYSAGYGSANYYTNYVNASAQSNTTSNYLGVGATNASVATTASGYSISHGEMRIICIPPQSGKVVNGFIIKSLPYRNCDLLRFPSKKVQASKKFNIDDSPVKFKNIIAYGFDESITNPVIVELSYWVSEITNYTDNNFFESKYPEYCGQKLITKEYYYKYENPQDFFIVYPKTTESVFEH